VNALTRTRLKRLRALTERIAGDKKQREELIRTLHTEDGVSKAVIAEAACVTESAIYQVVNPRLPRQPARNRGVPS
jgi:hypothetical protein